MNDEQLLDVITGRSDRPRYELVRFAFLRLLGFVYAFAFLGASQQLPALIGAHGLLPVEHHLADLAIAHGSRGAAFVEQPTLFFLGASDGALVIGSYAGLALSLCVLAGATNSLLMAILWALYLSIVHVGQVFYGYGWEILLLETGFLAIFLCPIASLRPFPPHTAPLPVIWLLRWLCFRVMFGAGLIKMRGDACWEDLTCLVYHYETQPLPNPISPWLHHMPGWFHTCGVLVNHVVELIVPFGLFAPRPVRIAAGLIVVAFQMTLIVSGNLSFLNWLTIATALASLDDRFLRRLIPIAERETAPYKPHTVAAWVLFAIVVVLSVSPVMNMLSYRQAMNTSFDRLHLVNTYGAFGSVTRVRHEVILEGSYDGRRWREYELPCKPGDPDRPPCLRAPYHYRLDWQLWFASFRDYEREPWIVHLIAKLLRGERTIMTLFANDPFPDRPPRYVRAMLYRYEMRRPTERGWWRREAVEEYIRPLSRDDPDLREFLQAYGWDRR